MKHTPNQYILFVMVIILTSGCATMQGHWKDAKTKDTIAAYTDFLKNYPEGELSDQAQKRLEELYLADAKAKNTILAYEEFLQKYPESEVIPEIKKRISELQVIDTNTILNKLVTKSKEEIQKKIEEQHNKNKSNEINSNENNSNKEICYEKMYYYYKKEDRNGQDYIKQLSDKGTVAIEALLKILKDENMRILYYNEAIKALKRVAEYPVDEFMPSQGFVKQLGLWVTHEENETIVEPRSPKNPDIAGWKVSVLSAQYDFNSLWGDEYIYFFLKVNAEVEKSAYNKPVAIDTRWFVITDNSQNAYIPFGIETEVLDSSINFRLLTTCNHRKPENDKIHSKTEMLLLGDPESACMPVGLTKLRMRKGYPVYEGGMHVEIHASASEDYSKIFYLLYGIKKGSNDLKLQLWDAPEIILDVHQK